MGRNNDFNGGPPGKKKKRGKSSGRECFFDFYAELFSSRWPELLKALTGEESKPSFSAGLLKPYHLSAASIAVAKALPVSGKTDILDMCAAPGGKTLVLASGMDAGSKLTANEFSRARRARLRKVLDEYLPPDKLGNISVSGYDGARWSRYDRLCFDSILLDAPCSSERHVLADESSLAQWTPSRVRNLAVKQWSLLSGAWLLLRPGGTLVYSTCALSPLENGGVVDRLLRKYGNASVSLPGEDFFSDPMLNGVFPEYSGTGISILPDTSGGAGPIFFSVIKKTGEDYSPE